MVSHRMNHTHAIFSVENFSNSCTSCACNLLVPSGPPINIAASDITSSSITLVWSPPDPREANGVIVGYKIMFTRVDFQDTTEDDLGARERSFTKQGINIMGILPQHIYSCT